MSKKPNYIIVLNALEAGQKLELPDGYTYAMDDGNFCYIAKRHNAGDPEDVYDELYCFADHMTVGYFIKMCGTMHDDDIAKICMNMVVNKEKGTKGGG